MPAKLVVLAGPDEGRVFPLGAEALLLGRSRATESHLIDPHVSRVHCQIVQEGGQQILVDFDSAGGTFVNGTRVSKHPLSAGDIIRIGNTRLQFVAEGQIPAPAQDTVDILDKVDKVPLLQPVGQPRIPAWVGGLAGTKISHYKVGSLLARGKTGYVFHARDTRRNLAVALKVLDPALTSSEESVRRFVAAMKSVLPLRHPNLVKVFGAGKTGPYCWLAMEYVEGESLAAIIGRIETAGMLDWRQVLRVGTFLARAVDYAHQKKLVHQAVTPQNILLGRTMNETKLADLMLAAAVSGDPTTPISAAGVPSEELSYLPPECTDGATRKVDGRADIYSLGATLYAMLVGHAPLQGSTVHEVVRKIRTEMPMSLAAHQLDVPEAFEKTLMKMMAKAPEDRFPTSRDLLKQFEALARSHDVLL